MQRLEEIIEGNWSTVHPERISCPKDEVLVALALLPVSDIQLLCALMGAMQDGISAEPGKRNQTCST